MKTIKIILLIVLITLLSACTDTKTSEKNNTKENVSSNKIEENNANEADNIKSENSDNNNTLDTSDKKDKPRFITNFTLELNKVSNNNLIEDDGVRKSIICLPPSYYNTEKKYPVIYYFHGYQQTPGDAFVGDYARIAQMMEEGELEEVILVEVNVSNKFDGSFMANSPVIGLWEDAFIEEILPYVEANYRVIGTKETRGIMGFSMGGYIAVNLALNHPDYFNALYAIGPGLLKDDELNLAMDSWTRFPQFIEAYGSAFCPKLDTKPYYEFPIFDGSEKDNEVVDKWLDGYGHIEKKISEYKEKSEYIAGIGLEVAENEAYKWLRDGTVYFSEHLTREGFENTLVMTKNGHSLTRETVIKNALPYLLKYLTASN